MSSAIGAEATFAAKRASTWGTAVACGAGDGFITRAGGGAKKERPSSVDDSLGLGIYAVESDQGEITAGATYNNWLRFRGLDLFLAMVLGTSDVTHPEGEAVTCTGGTATTAVKAGAGWTPDEHIGKFFHVLTGTNAGKTREITDNDATTLTFDTMTDTMDNADTGTISEGVGTHVYDIANNLDGLFITACENNGVNIDELPSAKVTGLTIKGDVGKPTEIVFEILANDRTTESTTNTLITFASVTTPGLTTRCVHDYLKMRMNAQDGDALDDDDRIYPGAWELSFKKPMAGVYGSGSSSSTIDEPSNNGQVAVTFGVTLQRYTSSAHFVARDANTRKKADITFTGPNIPGTSTPMVFMIQLPNLGYSGVELPLDAGIRKHELKFYALGCSSAPTGMTGVVRPLRITCTNDYPGDPLQN